jgi:hypothetical protein
VLIQANRIAPAGDSVVALSALLTAWAREAERPGEIGFTDRIRGGVTGAVTGAAAGVRGERPG